MAQQLIMPRTRKPRRPGRWAHPAALEREYVRDLRRIALQIEAAVNAHVMPVLSELREDDFSQIPKTSGWYERLRQAFAEASIGLITTAAMMELVASIGSKVSAFNKRQFHRLLRRAYGVDLFVAEPSLVALLATFEAENIRLIESIPRQALEKMRGRVVAAVRKGESVKTMREMIQREYGVTRSRAELIARDQIGKLNGDLTKVRQKNIGVTQYIWRTSRDERVRDTHQAHEGMTFEWDSPPSGTGHPGEDFQCRCNAEAKLPLLQDIQGLQYGIN